MEIQTSKGSLNWRLPNIPEGMMFMSFFEKINSNKDVWVIRSKIIENAEMLIDYKQLGYSNYAELLNDKENMSKALIDISEKMFDDILELLLKKN